VTANKSALQKNLEADKKLPFAGYSEGLANFLSATVRSQSFTAH